MFECDSYYDRKREEAINNWCKVKAKEFKSCVRQVISEDNYKYIESFALAMAWDTYSEVHISKFCKDFDLTKVDALCVLHEYSSTYEKEIEEAFQEECANDAFNAVNTDDNYEF